MSSTKARGCIGREVSVMEEVARICHEAGVDIHVWQNRYRFNRWSIFMAEQYDNFPDIDDTYILEKGFSLEIDPESEFASRLIARYGRDFRNDEWAEAPVVMEVDKPTYLRSHVEREIEFYWLYKYEEGAPGVWTRLNELSRAYSRPVRVIEIESFGKLFKHELRATIFFSSGSRFNVAPLQIRGMRRDPESLVVRVDGYDLYWAYTAGRWMEDDAPAHDDPWPPSEGTYAQSTWTQDYYRWWAGFWTDSSGELAVSNWS